MPTWKPSNEVSRSETNDQPAVLSSANVARPGNDVSLEVHDPVAPDTPEVLRSDDFEYDSNEISLFSQDDDSEGAEYTQYICDFESPNRFSILSDIDNDVDKQATGATSTSKPDGGNIEISCLPCNDRHKCFECLYDCDVCQLSCTPGPMFLKCFICRKKFSNQEFTKKDTTIEIYIPRGEIISFFTMEFCGGSQNRAIVNVAYNI